MEEWQSFLCKRLPSNASNTYLTPTLTFNLPYRYEGDMETTSGYPPCLLAFSPNTLKGFSMQTRVIHTDFCPLVTHPSCPCAYVNREHLR